MCMLVQVSSRRDFTHRSCRQVSVAARYSASVVESTTSRCNRDLQQMGPEDNKMTYPEVDRLVDGSPAKPASVYA